MRNLYLRFFTAFWIAMVLVLACTVVATSWLADERRDAQIEQENQRQDSVQREAQAVLQGDGVDGLKEWLQRQQRQWNSQGNRDWLYVVDEQGHDLAFSGRPVPPNILARIGRAPFPSGPGNATERRTERPLSILKEPATGASYVLSLSSPRMRPTGVFGLFGSPDFPVIWAALALIISAVVCFLLARFLSAPIKLLRDATHSIAAGNLDVRVSNLMGKRRDELGALAIDFDAMAVRLRTLLNSQQTLLRDVSHELRSPLARMQIALGIARRPGANIDQGFDRIEQEAQRLDELIGEILSLCRLDDPARTIHAEAVEVDELLETLVDDALIEAEPKQVKLQLQQQTPGLVLQGDRELLHRAIENVLRNAVRFSPADGIVLVSVERSGNFVSISIRDRGQGVPEAHLEKIFEPFHRVAEARDRASGGHGIGLAITSRVVALHNGTVTAANANGGGLLVTIKLPASSATPEAT
jgi:two-component system sensor histidine kinase CpxA